MTKIRKGIRNTDKSKKAGCLERMAEGSNKLLIPSWDLLVKAICDTYKSNKKIVI